MGTFAEAGCFQRGINVWMALAILDRFSGYRAGNVLLIVDDIDLVLLSSQGAEASDVKHSTGGAEQGAQQEQDQQN
jgi:hypothetical protein